MGIKPLYYINECGSVAFASEIKALLPLKREIKPDLSVLFDILNGGTACEPYTVFADIFALNPGHYIHLKPGMDKVEQRGYFSIFDHVDESLYREYGRASLVTVAPGKKLLVNDAAMCKYKRLGRGDRAASPRCGREVGRTQRAVNGARKR